MSHFPNDENGDVLRQMHERGDDLSRSRDIDFNVIFPNEACATEFALSFSRLGLQVSSEQTAGAPELPWDVRVVKHMVPTHADICEFEAILEGAAAKLGGQTDGWGCFEA